MNSFNEGFHEGDEISQMSNSEILLYLFIEKDNVKDLMFSDKQTYEEIIKELDYRIRANSIDIESIAF